MEKLIKKILDGSVELVWKVFIAIIIIVVGFKIVEYILNRVKKTKGFNKIEKTSQSFILSILSVSLKIIVVIIAITNLGIPITSVITILGSAGLALGLALQGGLSNIAGGVMIMLFKPFKVGDYIDTHADSGTVKEINIFHTVLTTIDNKTIVLPNGNLSNSVIVNYTKMKDRRVDIDVSVSYNSDIDKVKKVLQEIAEKNTYRLKNKEIFIGLKEHSDSALIFTFRVWVSKDNYWDARFEMLEQIKKEFDKNNISIPFPQMDVHVNNVK